MISKEDLIKVDFSVNPFQIQLPPSFNSSNKSIQLDEILIETHDASCPAFLKLHCDQACFFDEHLNKSTEMEMIPKTNVWGTLTQYYKGYDQSKDYIALGMTNTVNLSITDQSDTTITLADYSTCRIVLRVTHY